MEKKILVLPKGWKRTTEKYQLQNDQRLENLDNLICPSQETVSLFKINEDKDLGLYMFEKMLKDYSKITTNLKLLYIGKINIKKNNISIYIIREKFSSKYLAHVLFVLENTLYALIFNIKDYKPSLKQMLESNITLKEVINLLEAQF